MPHGEPAASGAPHAEHHPTGIPDGETRSAAPCPAHLCCAPVADEIVWPLARTLCTTPYASAAAGLLPRLPSADLFRPPEAGPA
jgi:hypothetical protein